MMKVELPETVHVRAVMDDDTEIAMDVTRTDLMDFVEGMKEFLVGKGVKSYKAISRSHTVYLTWEVKDNEA